jgi:hypothetical protein
LKQRIKKRKSIADLEGNADKSASRALASDSDDGMTDVNTYN